MSDGASDHVVFGALGTVCTVLLGAAGLSTKQLSALVTSLQRQLQQRDKDVADLNTALLKAAREAGQSDHLQLQVDNLESDNESLEEQLETVTAERDAARIELERLLKLYRQAVPKPGEDPPTSAETIGS